MIETINFCGTVCEVIERYELSKEYMEEYELSYSKRIKFITPSGEVVDCADTF